MKEGLTDALKYNHVCWELQNLLDDTFGKHNYWVSGSICRHISIHPWVFGFLSFLREKRANVYAIDEEGYGEITVYDKKLYSILKEYGEKNKYPKLIIGFKKGET